MCYYFIGYYIIYLPGNVYRNTFGSGCSEVVAVTCGGILYSFFAAKKSFQISYVVSILGGILILWVGHNYLSLMPVFVILAKFGVSSGFLVSYTSTMDLFPTLFCATAFGICNFMSCFVTILAPYMAQMTAPIPMIIFCVIALIGLVLSFAINQVKSN